MKSLVAALGLIVIWVGLAAAQTQLPVRFGANGVPLTPFTEVNYFGWLPPHATMPSELKCAQEIAQTSEGIGDNAPMNNTIPTGPELVTYLANPAPGGGTPISPSADFQLVTGDYATLLATPPSTDMLIRWSACKWGIDEDTLRAQMWTESGWHEDTASDFALGSGNCVVAGLSPTIFDTTIGFANGSEVRYQGGCFQSFGISQEKIFFFYTQFPTIKESTAFSLDVRGASERACINGDQVAWFQGNNTCTATSSTPGHGNCNEGGATPSAAQILDIQQGCVATHFSGDWWSQNAQNYWNTLSGFLAQNPKPWPGGR